MTRENTGKSTILASLGLALVVGLATACSGTNTGDGTDNAGGDDDSTSTSHSGKSSGKSSGSSSGDNGDDDDSGSSGSSTGSSSGSHSGSTAADAGKADSGGGSTSTTDLAPPAAADGIQVATPAYKAGDANASQMVVPPGQEIFLCYYYTLPNSAEVDVGAFQSLMSEGSSHHFIVYQGGTGPTAGFFGSQPSGTIVPCAVGTGTWVYATSTPGEVVGMKMPDTVGLPFAAGTQIVLNMHFINTSTKPLYPSAKLNILFAKNVKYKAAAMVSFNTQINVPKATAAGPGKQTVGGTCTAPAGSNFFIMSTHSHKHATAVTVNFIHGGQSTEIVHTGAATAYPTDQQAGTGQDWEHPGVGAWDAPSFLKTAAGDSFKYQCTFENDDTTTAVTVGEKAATNEMCMAIGYYYPAGTTSCN